MENNLTYYNSPFITPSNVGVSRKPEPVTRNIASMMNSLNRRMKRKANDINRKGKRKYGF